MNRRLLGEGSATDPFPDRINVVADPPNAARDFGHCIKCRWEELGVTFHGVGGCVPMGSDNPCWEPHWTKQEHFRITCRRCGYARVDDVTPEAVPA